MELSISKSKFRDQSLNSVEVISERRTLKKKSMNGSLIRGYTVNINQVHSGILNSYILISLGLLLNYIISLCIAKVLLVRE